MTDPDLVAALSTARHLPASEILQALAEPERIAAPVLDALRRAGEGADLTDAEADLLFWGLHALAGARDTRVFRPLLVLLRQDADTLDAILGDAVTETLARILISVFDGDPAPLQALILDSTIDGGVRNELFAVLTYLTQAGRIPRQDTHALLERFDDKCVAVEGDVDWLGWEETIALLGFGDLAPRVDRARADKRLDREFSDPIWFRRQLRETEDEPDDTSRFDPRRYATLDDPVAALGWTAEDYGQPVRNPFKTVGRNDPCPCGSGKKFKKCCLDAVAN